MPYRILLPALLAVSVALNAVLLLRKASDSASQPADTALLQSSEPLPRPMFSVPHPPGVARSPTPGADPRCSARVAELERELNQLKGGAPKYRSAKEKFAEGQPNPGNVARLEPELRRLLTLDGGTLPWSVDCRGDACRLQMLVSKANGPASLAAANSLGRDAKMQALVAGTLRSAGDPTQDAVTGEQLTQEEVYFSMRSPEDTDSYTAFRTFASSLIGSTVVRDCTNGYQQTGVVKLQAQPSPSGGFQAVVTGPLAMGPAGPCLRSGFQRVLDTGHPPSRWGPITILFSSPPDAPAPTP